MTASLSGQSLSKRGYPEHFIVGAFLSGTVSYIVYTKTDNKLKAWLIGLGASVVVGGIKEALDPSFFGGTRNVLDFEYTVLGGVLGASIIIPMKGKKPKDTPPVSSAF
jgi:hypothetical protein